MQATAPATSTRWSANHSLGVQRACSYWAFRACEGGREPAIRNVHASACRAQARAAGRKGKREKGKGKRGVESRDSTRQSRVACSVLSYPRMLDARRNLRPRQRPIGMRSGSVKIARGRGRRNSARRWRRARRIELKRKRGGAATEAATGSASKSASSRSVLVLAAER